jgi:Uma2 family endonuclease
MGMPYTARRYTVDEVLAFPSDGNRYELAHGELLVTPAPRLEHQRAVGRVFRAVAAYLERCGAAAEAFTAPADISWARDVLVQPDVFVVPAAETAGGWQGVSTLLLAVEVLSPSTARSDRVVKRRLYQEFDVRTYWVVDLDARVVEVWQPGDERPQVVTDVLRWRVAPEAAELAIELQEVFG